MNPIRIARNKFRSMRRAKVLYLTYVLRFPDGEQWQKQEQFSSTEIDVRLKNMIAEHRRTRSEWYQRAGALWRYGECWWKDAMGVEHMMLIEDKKRVTKWGMDQKGFASFIHGSTDDGRGGDQ